MRRGTVEKSISLYIVLGMIPDARVRVPSWMVTDRQSARLAFLEDFVTSAARFHPDASLVKGPDCFHSAWKPSVVRNDIDQWQWSSSRPTFAQVVVAMRLGIPMELRVASERGQRGISASTLSTSLKTNQSVASIRCPDR